MFLNDLGSSWTSLAVVLTATVGAYLALITFSRIAGLRSFAQMTNFDLAATVAFGSIVATTAVNMNTSLLEGAVGLAALFIVQSLLAWWRRHDGGERVLDSGPLLLMSGDRVLTHHLSRAQMTQDDLYSKLRLAGITQLQQVAAVVLESTGDVAVITAGSDDPLIDRELFVTVDGHEELTFADRA